MSGGIFSKIGNWYEEEGALRHLLLVLDDQEQVLLWEGLQLDEPGVDCWVKNERGRVAEQYKTKSDGAWTISALKDSRARADGTRSSSVLDYARFQLRRTDADAASEFHFISNAPAPELSAAIAEARTVADPQQWMVGDVALRTKVVAGFHLDPARPDHVVEVHGLLRHMLVRTIDGQTLSEDNLIIARILAPASPDRLLATLRTLARASLTRRITPQDVRAAVAAAGINPVAPTEHLRSVDHLADAIAVFTASLAASRGLTVVPRTDIAESAAREALASDRARTVIVHGPAGVGKSEVLLQTIEKLQASGVATLVMRADQAEQPPLGPDPVRSLSRSAGGKRACLVIDQLDQVILAGDRFQHLIAPLTKWIILARAMNIAVVIGCRTIDVEQDTHLRRVLCPDDADRYRKIAVGDLTEEQATAILTQAGIPVSTINPELAPLVRRPLVLRLLTELVRRGGAYTRARTILDLVVAWWEEMRQPHGDLANEILTAFVLAVEQDGQLAVDRLSLPHQTIVTQLISTGVLIDAGQGRVRPFHQVLVDVWLALQWKGVGSVADLLTRIGPRADQSVHHARRLRLTVQLFASRGDRGARICDDILRSAAVRPLLKRAMLLGVAAIDAPSPPWVDLVKAWLADPHYFAIVRATVVYNRLPWMDKLSSWLQAAWTTYPVEQRSELIRLLAAVGDARGDLVAACLSAWLQHDPTVLQQAEFVFWHDPSKDSDRLFELRLRHLTEGRHHRDHNLTWDTLVRANPTRGVRLLAYHVNRANDDELQERPPDWFHSWPPTASVEVRSTGLLLWELIRDRWSQIVVTDSWRVRTGSTRAPADRSVLACVVDALAGCFAQALQEGALTWSRLLAQLPPTTRQIDKWLLLRVGAACDARRVPPEQLADAVRWFMGDVTLGQLSMGSHIESSRFAEKFLAGTAAGLDRVTFAVGGLEAEGHSPTHDHLDLEQWLLGYPERLVTATSQPDDDAARELERAEKVTYRLLGRTDRGRWSAETLAFYESLHRRFEDGLAAVEPNFETRGGWVRSDIQDDLAMAMSCEEWVVALQSAAPQRTWVQSATDPDTVLSSDLQSRLRQLRRVVHRHQRRFYDGIEVFLVAIPPLPLDVLEIVVDGIISTNQPDRFPPNEVWAALDDALVFTLFMNPRIRDCAETVMSLTDAVRNRSNLPWPDEVVARLEAIARGETVAGVRYEGTEDIVMYRLNERCCRAIDALANIAHDHESRRARLLPLAEELQSHPDIGRRASAAFLACHIYSADPERGFNVLLSVASDRDIAAERDVNDALLFLVRCPLATPRQQHAARDLLLGLVHGDDRQARRGGSALLLLRAWDLMTTEQMTSELARSVVARTSAARTLAEGLQVEKAPEPWMREIAVQFARDDAGDVGEAIMQAFEESYEHLLAIPGFFAAMAETRAASHDPENLLELFCRSAEIVGMASEVLRVTSTLVDAEATAERQWTVQRRIELGVNALQALVAQAEQAEDTGVRSRALDIWDGLIERNELVAQNKLDRATDFSLG